LRVRLARYDAVIIFHAENHYGVTAEHSSRRVMNYCGAATAAAALLRVSTPTSSPLPFISRDSSALRCFSN